MRSETDLQVIVTVLTNLGLVPAIVYAWRRESFFHFVSMASTLLVSIAYHLAEVWHTTFLGMTPGNWHRLDNVFAILSVQSLFLYWADFKTHASNDLARWTCLVFCLWCQEKGPWRVEFTIIPITLAVVIMLGKFAYTRQVPAMRKGNFFVGLAFSLVGIAFFVRGLNESTDWLRLNHNLWHFFIGCAAYFQFQSKLWDVETRPTLEPGKKDV